MLGTKAGKLVIYGLAAMGAISAFEGNHARADGSMSPGMMDQLQHKISQVGLPGTPPPITTTQHRSAERPAHMQVQMPVPKPGGAARYLYWDYNDLVGIHKGQGAKTRNAGAPPERRGLTSTGHLQATGKSAIGIATAPASIQPPSHGFDTSFVTQQGERGPWDAAEFRAPKPGEEINALNAIPRAVGALEEVSRVLGSLSKR